MAFHTHPTGGTSTERFVIRSDGSSEFKGAVKFEGGIVDSGGDQGNSGQYLQTSGSDVNWASPPGSSGNSTFKGKYSGTITGDGSDKTFTVQHNLGTQNVIVSVRAPGASCNSIENCMTAMHGSYFDIGYDGVGGVLVGTFDDDLTLSSNHISLKFGAAPANGEVITITVIG